MCGRHSRGSATLRAKLIPVEAIAVAVADHVEPEPGQVLSEARALEQFIYERIGGGVDSVGRGRLLETDDLVGRGRQASKIVIQSTS